MTPAPVADARRRTIFRALATTLLVATGADLAPVGAQQTPSPADTGRPITALGWMVGGVWTADASKLGGGLVRIETRYTWADNNAFIRFNTHFVTAEKANPTYDGQFFWNPAEPGYAMWYMDASNEIVEGRVRIAGDTLVMTFSAAGAQSASVNYRVTLVRHGPDLYDWTLEAEGVTGWRRFMGLVYRRG